MAQRMTGTALRLLSLLLTIVLSIGVFTVVKNLGWLSPFGIESESHDSQVIRAIKRTQEVSLLSLGIQGITDQTQSREIFGQSIPGSGETVFLQYNFDAKLGIDGAQVTVMRTSENGYRVSVPEFIFIGYEEPTFKVAVEDGGPLSWVTPDIDQLEMVNEILDDEAQSEYVASHEDLLKDQTELFYDRLITSIDPSATTAYKFSSYD